MKLLLALVLMPTISLGGESHSGEISWLVGCWVTPDNSAQEVWVANGTHSLAGFSVSINNDKISFYEVLNVNQSEDGTWIYTAHPSGQTSASFVAIEITDNSVVFSNPDHDYPQEIKYKREGNHLYATISLLDGIDPNSFYKIACK